MNSAVLNYCTGRITAALGLGLLFFSLAFGPVVLFPRSFVEIPLSGSVAAVCAVLLLAASRFETPRKDSLPAAAAALVQVVIYCASDLLLRPHGFIRTTFPLLLFIVLFLILFAAGRIAKTADLRGRFAAGLLGATSAAGLAGYLHVTGGGLIFSDDHPCFLYRLIQLKSAFPAIPFYNPFWNGGVEAREFFPSAALNLFLLYWPLIHFFDVTAIYPAIIGSFLFVLVPAVVIIGCRCAGCSFRCGVLSAALALCASLYWYRWTLVYGTMGFAVSAALLPLNLLLVGRLMDPERGRPLQTAAAAAVTITLMLLWSPSCLLIAPAALFVFFSLLKNREQLRIFVLLGAFLLILNLPWMAVFVKVSRVGDFVAVSGPVAAESSEAAPAAEPSAPTGHDLSKFKIADNDAAGRPLPQRLIRLLRENAAPANPLVVFFGLAGLLLLPRPAERRLFAITAVTAAVLGLGGPIVKPQLELERMFVVLSLLLALPGGCCLNRLLEAGDGRGLARGLLPAFLFAGLFLLPVWIWKVTTNQTHERYSVAGPGVRDLVEQISACGPGGRVLFAGFTLHELNSYYLGKTRHGGGHIAPLAAWTGRPLVASSYQHDRWRYSDVVPEYYRSRKDQGISEYLDLMNISCVVTHDRFWRQWYGARPDRFRRRGEAAGFQLFERLNYKPDYFLEGQGEVLEQADDQVKLKISTGGAVIKFNFLPFIAADGCSVGAAPQTGPIKLIKLENCAPGAHIVLKARSIWSRLF